MEVRETEYIQCRFGNTHEFGSAFIGLIAMILLFPVPGAIASMIQGVQKEKMKKTDARVQNVTESESYFTLTSGRH